MKIIISPSKTYSLEKAEIISDHHINDKSYVLFNKIKNMSKLDLSIAFNIKSKLLNETYDLYHEGFSNNLFIKAIDYYNGVVFSQLNISKYTVEQRKYMDSHLIILSAMYGFLQPSSLVIPYRLDMTVKIPDINLYEYWQEEVSGYFKDDDLIINLASNEFSKMLKNKRKSFISIDFYDSANKKTPSYNTKKMRGLMLNHIIENQIIDVKAIREFSCDNYVYDKNLSTVNNYVFIKK
ncbi:MAG: YaaA family protein [Candidatus Izemoplasmatales bacterium]|nr:YaaA family protein [Candidatus Izemoplasmatales bacterium]